MSRFQPYVYQYPVKIMSLERLTFRLGEERKLRTLTLNDPNTKVNLAQP